MVRLIGFLVILMSAFGLGYYSGQHGIGDLREGVIGLSRTAFDSALGMGVERNLQWRTDLIEAKASVVEAKSEVMNRNFGNASRELARAMDSLQAAGRVERDPQRVAAARNLAARVRDIKVRISTGKIVPRSGLDDIQHELDTLLAH